MPGARTCTIDTNGQVAYPQWDEELQQFVHPVLADQPIGQGRIL